MLPAWMTSQVAAAHQRHLDRLISDRVSARFEAHTLPHACLADWLRPDEGGRVLELGCGPGKYVAILAALGYEVVAIDPLEFPSWDALRQIPEVTLQSRIYAEQLPFASESFDHVVCLGALLYFENPEESLSEMHRVMKPEGKLILRTVNRTNLYTSRTGKPLDPASKHLYNLQELSNLLEKHGFRVENKFSYGFMPPILTNFWWYLISVWLPLNVQLCLSRTLPEVRRHNNIVFARKHVDQLA